MQAKSPTNHSADGVSAFCIHSVEQIMWVGDDMLSNRFSKCALFLIIKGKQSLIARQARKLTWCSGNDVSWESCCIMITSPRPRAFCRWRSAVLCGWRTRFLWRSPPPPLLFASDFRFEFPPPVFVGCWN